MKRQIILASVSPRRRQLMELLQIKVKFVESGYEEIVQKHLSHSELVKFLALGKAKAAAKKYPNAIIIAADTMVSFRGKIIGKPKSKQEAVNMLKSFSGKPQDLLTGVVVMDSKNGKYFSSLSKSKIYFKKLSSLDINNYLSKVSPYDKCGGYDLRGASLNLLQKVEGDFTNNFGLPMNFVVSTMLKLGVEI